MGLINWFQDRWLMMMRTKPHYISILGRKRSSIRSPPKLSPRGGGKSGKKFSVFMCIVTMFCSVSYGVLLVLSDGISASNLTTYVVSLAIAGIVAISGGMCLSEYINIQSQEVPSIYSCSYQYSSEVLAFFIGWTWILSQAAVISAICKVLTAHVNDWTEDVPRKFLESTFHAYAKDIPSLIFVIIFVLFILTGIGETVVWYALFIPIAFIMISAMTVIGCVMTNAETIPVDTFDWNNIEEIEKILTLSALCILFFSGPQSTLRIPPVNVRRNTTAVLAPLNAIILIIAFVSIVAASLPDKITNPSSENELLSLASNILCTISLCSLGIEAFYPLHYAIEDMASDGLLFRTFSKKWKPFCFPVLSFVVHAFTFIAVGVMSVLLPLLNVMHLAVVFPLLVNSMVPFLVLTQRYRDNTSWQYEPMLHTSARSAYQDRSKKKNHEFQYSNAPGFDITEGCEVSTACVGELSETSSDADTDVDSIVQQYKDQTRVANMANLDDPMSSSQTPEPTPSSSFRAKFCIIILIGMSLIVSVTLNFADSKDHFSVIVIVLLCVLFSTVVQGLLICLPQNQSVNKAKGCCARMPSMPWTPGMASLISSSLLLHVLIQTWKVFLGYFVLGILLYFTYGIRSSTAANSFYNMKTAHITLRPLPSYGNNCIPQIIPSQQKAAKSRKHKKIKTGQPISKAKNSLLLQDKLEAQPHLSKQDQHAR